MLAGLLSGLLSGLLLTALLLARLLLTRLLLTRLLLALLILLATEQLLHLLARLFGFAAQHLLLVLLLRQLLRIRLLLLTRQILLALSQFIQLLHRVVDFLLLLLLLRAAGTGIGLVLVLLLIELQIEQVGQIAAGATPAAASSSATTAADLNLDIAERRFGAQQVLKSLLLGLQGILERLRLQLIRRRRHDRDGRIHFLDEHGECRAGAIQLAGLGAVGKRFRLIAQLRLHFGKILSGIGRRGLCLSIALQLVKRGGDDFLFALGNLLILLVSTATAASACLLRLRVVEFKRHRFDEHHVRLLRIPAIAGDRVKADDIAWHGLEIFHGKQRGAFRLL